MFISYLKSNGELVPPMMTSEISLTLKDVWGEEKARIYEPIYGFINISDNLEVMHNPKAYYVDVETKKLLRKSVTDSIQYLE